MSKDTVALNIIEQLGGYGKLRAMVNARNLVYDFNWFKFQFSGFKYANLCRIILDDDDTYTVEFWQLGGKGCSLIKSVSGVYNTMLRGIFTDYTGLDLSLGERR